MKKMKKIQHPHIMFKSLAEWDDVSKLLKKCKKNNYSKMKPDAKKYFMSLQSTMYIYTKHFMDQSILK